jgi:CMP-N,N'-diacetyllegionaminic acid synthase
MSTIAIIPARGGSKGLKRKNILDLAGKPLIAHTIISAKNSKNIDHVVVSTDDEEIAEVSKEFGAEVPFLRPEELATDTATTIDVLEHAISAYENLFGNIIQDVILLQPTSPLRNDRHIKEAYTFYMNSGRTPVVSVCKANTHPQIMRIIKNGYLVNLIDGANIATRRQDFQEVYQLNGAIYISPKTFIMEQHRLYDDKVLPYVMGIESSIDIDNRLDFLFAKTVLENGEVK